jgi:hypothetical protein
MKIEVLEHFYRKILQCQIIQNQFIHSRIVWWVHTDKRSEFSTHFKKRTRLESSAFTGWWVMPEYES